MFWVVFIFPFLLFSQSIDERLYLLGYKENKQSKFLSRSDNIPEGRLSDVEDTYLEGYIQSLIDTHYYEFGILVLVKDRVVYLYNMPNNFLTKEAIVSFVQDLPDVERVVINKEEFPDQELKEIEQKVGKSKMKGIWFPESTVLFPPLIANPRFPNYSISYRFGNDFLAKDTAAVSLGDFFPVYRFVNVGKWNMDIQIDFGACVWTLFNMNAPNGHGDEWARLDNSDYLASLPISLAFDRWAFRLQLYHISTHLGDEYICNLLYEGKDVCRVNPSFEALELIGSYQLTDGLRLYAGPGWIINSDNSYPMGDAYVEYGFEGRWFGKRMNKQRLFGCPFVAVDVQNWQCTDWRFSLNALVGYEWSKLHGVGRKFRIYAQYHNGNSEGQFFKNHLQYAAIGISWGF